MRFPVSLFFLAVVLGACVTSQAEFELPAAAAADSEYYPVMKKWQRSVEVNQKFQKRIDVNAVLFTEEMRRAYSARSERIRGESRELSDMEGGKMGILVSFYTPDGAYAELDNRDLWNIRVRDDQNQFMPAAVKYITKKSLFEANFPFVNKWTREYLIVYEPVAGETGSESLKVSQSITLEMRSPLAVVNLTWQ